MLVGIAGGSGSGKSTLARALCQSFGPAEVQLLNQDMYYRDRQGVPLEERQQVNYDHPDAFDEELLLAHLTALKAGRAVEQPLYDFARHERSGRTLRVEAARVVIVEGILVLAIEAVRAPLDLKLFVDTPDDIRFLRRLRRDVADRGRSIDSVIEQYLRTVRPMHHAFVEPSRRHADLIVPEGGENEVALGLIRAWIARLLG
jgi:uridine kinase